MPLIIVIIAAGIIGAVVYMQRSSDTYKGDDAMMEDDMTKDDAMMEGDEMMEGDATMEVPAPGNEGVDEMMEGGDVMMEGESPKTVTVTYTQNGFSPSPVNVSVGDTVRFMNESGRSFWPASAFHPTHTVYPGSDIKKCGTAEAATIFDACREIVSGQSYSFTFTEAGTWNYHDHLNASEFGSIIVK
ncbi:MAG: hypothetical protein COU47_03325 [Candidatus Niyogibacteria bacterium CG10_big_fil_rev_8_21_14_0_10_46_36]|uniref:Blue (type 1) copper domain-containing protein n=1 Tax=Candidatus Niyogibacteria bacterium CG10_big_fil_rev_8_21_14_0_10_46_36 TaxID=1974726 RepID=A0A2H0TEY3_9BACT|nr:MAG: hypothetical protein COU47_03325 [Candidatus Niyogibacteria bacterium CG10_big_fil_rev_8_21_14_0_10_46_36]